ncbi:MAG TPA: right-handed parallel beta-helix repeat-containing protein [Humisphaera sp.]
MRTRRRNQATRGLEPLENRLLLSTYTVTGLGDAAGTVTPTGADSFDATTLRAAVAAANARAGADLIRFTAGLSGTVSLLSALPRLQDTLTITGPGASGLAVERSAAARGAFPVVQIAKGTTVAISGLTLAKGKGRLTGRDRQGGGVFNAGTLTMSDCTITGNTAKALDGDHARYSEVDGGVAEGGGIFSSGTLTLSRCTVTNNSAIGGDNFPGDGGDAYGGGIRSTGELTLTDCTVSGNATIGGDGGFYSYRTSWPLGGTGAGGGVSSGGTLSVTRCRVERNTVRGGDSRTDPSETAPYFADGSGGGIEATGVVYVSDSLIRANRAGETNSWSGSGGGILAGGKVAVSRCTISDNSTGSGGGGGVAASGDVTLADCRITGNAAGYEDFEYDSGYWGGGAGAQAAGTVTVVRCSLSGNRGPATIIAGGDDVEIVDSTVSQNEGGVTVSGRSTITGSRITGNGGTGVIASNGRTTIAGCTISSNRTGGIRNAEFSELLVTGSTISDNRAAAGAGIFTDNTSSLGARDCTIVGNRATGDGGGIYNEGGPVTLARTTLARNAARNGGAIFNGRYDIWYDPPSGTVALDACTLTGNAAVPVPVRDDATKPFGNGGGIFNDDRGTITLTNSTLADNSARAGDDPQADESVVTGRGGGIYSYRGAVGVRDSTLSGNSAGDGGGIYNDGGAVQAVQATFFGNTALLGNGGAVNNDAEGHFAALVLVQSTVVRNRAMAGGGVYNTGSARLANSILALNADALGAADDVAGALSAASAFNLVGTGKAGGLKTGVNGNRVGITAVQLKLAPLASNGGPTRTVALLAGSVAINAGSNALSVDAAGKPLAGDQRGVGFRRIVGGRVDAGAFERQASN